MSTFFQVIGSVGRLLAEGFWHIFSIKLFLYHHFFMWPSRLMQMWYVRAKLTTQRCHTKDCAPWKRFSLFLVPLQTTFSVFFPTAPWDRAALPFLSVDDATTESVNSAQGLWNVGKCYTAVRPTRKPQMTRAFFVSEGWNVPLGGSNWHTRGIASHVPYPDAQGLCYFGWTHNASVTFG